MRITTRLILAFLAVSILPLILVSYIEWRALDRVGSLAVEESTEALKRLGEASIRQKALSVARQVELYLEAHPDLLTLPPEALQADEALAAIAVQPVGETGYTAVHDNDGINHFHANPNIVGMDLHELAATLPAFWAILEANLDGTPVADYYEWQDADGAIRDKYMSCVPVGDTRLRVAATTYIDEFYRPIRDTEARIMGISQETRLQMHIAVSAVGLMAVLTAIFLATITIRPLRRIAEGVRLFGQGKLDHEIAVGTRGEIGQLATTLNQMMKSIQQGQGALRESEERYRGLFEGVPVGIYRSTPAGQFLDVNPAMAQMLGYPDRESLLAVEAADVHVNAEDREQWRTLLERKGVVRTYELQLRRRDGTVIWVTDNARVVRGQDDQVLYYEGTLEDITERKRAEKALREAHDRLEIRVKERTAELEQANEEIKQFAYTVSHDLRAPLVNLKGFAAELRSALEVIDSAMDTALPYLGEKQRQDVTLALQEDVPEALDFIGSSVTHMDRFISALLKLSRLGRRELNLELVDMEALVQATLETLAHQIEERQGQVTVGSLPEVVVDRTSMEQIMGNLLGNAVKYLDPGRPGEIEITAERGDNETTFRIRDNGRGIAEDDMDKVFAPFRRVSRQDVPGEGMGLPYVQALVRRHGGRLWCESELGVGTTFTFTISNGCSCSHLPEGQIAQSVLEFR